MIFLASIKTKVAKTVEKSNPTKTKKDNDDNKTIKKTRFDCDSYQFILAFIKLLLASIWVKSCMQNDAIDAELMAFII